MSTRSQSTTGKELLDLYARGRRHLNGFNLVGADLRGAELGGAKFTGAKLRHALLCDANLTSADLFGADLYDADLRCAILSNADLRQATLAGANLRGANLSSDPTFGRLLRDMPDECPRNLVEAALWNVREELFPPNEIRNVLLGDFLRQLRGTDLSGADLSGADLSDAVLGGTIFCGLDLSGVHGLDAARHAGPSIVGIDTIYRSRGSIPEPFLRGCGVPDALTASMASLATQPIEFYSCFISYSGKDEDFAKRLHARLQQDHMRVWFAPKEIKGGRKLHEQIGAAIWRYDKLLLVLSPHSMASLWVILKARQKEARQQGRVLFPIRLCSYDELRDWECLDADTGLDLAREVRSYFIPDFSSWKDHGAFEAGVTRLIADLRSEGKSA